MIISDMSEKFHMQKCQGVITKAVLYFFVYKLTFKIANAKQSALIAI